MGQWFLLIPTRASRGFPGASQGLLEPQLASGESQDLLGPPWASQGYPESPRASGSFPWLPGSGASGTGGFQGSGVFQSLPGTSRGLPGLPRSLLGAFWGFLTLYVVLLPALNLSTLASADVGAHYAFLASSFEPIPNRTCYIF